MLPSIIYQIKELSVMNYNIINQFKSLNNLAEPGGTVIFGGTSDLNIPLCELKQAYELNENYYNRSIDNLSVEDACEVYKACIAELKPNTVFLHIGQADTDKITNSSDKFIASYRKLINLIKRNNKKCRIAIVSLTGTSNETQELNKHLKYLADSERCEYCDITNQISYGPDYTKEITSFIYNVGFVQPLRNKRPLYSLTKVLFCYNA